MTMKTTMKNRCYDELIQIPTFEERLKYLSISAKPCDVTFGGHRYLNQKLYTSPMWKQVRRNIIIRDEGCDLACEEYPIEGTIYIHHINPITIEDIKNERYCIIDPQNLVCVSFDTHNTIHYCTEKEIDNLFQFNQHRRPNDTCPWL